MYILSTKSGLIKINKNSNSIDKIGNYKEKNYSD